MGLPSPLLHSEGGTKPYLGDCSYNGSNAKGPDYCSIFGQSKRRLITGLYCTSLVTSSHISAVGGTDNYHSSEHYILMASDVLTFHKFTLILSVSIIQRTSFGLHLILIDIPLDIRFLCTCLGQVARRFSGVNNVPSLSGILPNSRRMGTKVSPAQQDAMYINFHLIMVKGFLVIGPSLYHREIHQRLPKPFQILHLCIYNRISILFLCLLGPKIETTCSME